MKRTLIITNGITAFLLIGIVATEKYPQRILNKFSSPATEPKPAYSFINNQNYTELTDLYTVYTGQKDIVMLGNSLTNRISWNELLGRDDVANRGIGSDITAGFIHRLNFVMHVQPKICFIEGGVNDLAQNISNETIIKNLTQLLDTLQANHVKPVLTTVTLVTKSYKNASDFNAKIKNLNIQIASLAKSKEATLLDLNPYLTDGEYLRQENAIADGIHFNSKAYEVWREEIMKILKRENI